MSGQMTLLPGKVPTRLGVGGLLMVMVLLLCGALVIYPVVFLVAESLNTGEPGVFPPPETSLSNFAAIGEDIGIIGDTLAAL